MEVRAYVEGILRKWWFILAFLIVSFFVGNTIGNSLTTTYTAGVTILLNGPLLSSSAIPSSFVHINAPLYYESELASPAILSYINKHYPRLSQSALQQDIVVSWDAGDQLLLISVTDIKPESAADIANYLAGKFVSLEHADLKKQLDYYQNWLQQRVPQLEKEINTLTAQIQTLTPPPVRHAPPIDPKLKRTIVLDQYQLDRDQIDYYHYFNALNDLTSTRPLFQHAFVIMKPAQVSNIAAKAPLSVTLVELIALTSGLLIAIILIVAWDYFTPFVRHRGEMQRIAGLAVMAELPAVNSFEQKRLLELRPLFFRWRLNAIRLLAAAIGAPAVRDLGYTVLMTSPKRKRTFSAIIGALLARNGHETLLIDANFRQPTLQNQLKGTAPYNITTKRGLLLTFIQQTNHPRLFYLPATAMLPNGERINSTNLIQILPELQNTFGIIIIDAPPLTHADTHLLATKVKKTLLLVKKRRDGLNTLKVARRQCEDLKLDTQSLLLG